jgi:hypothetical protein
MARLTGNNTPRPIWLPYKSTEQIMREAVEAHETVGKRWGWVFAISFLLILLVDNAVLYYLIKLKVYLH